MSKYKNLDITAHFDSIENLDAAEDDRQVDIYRHELKYYIHPVDYHTLSRRLSLTMQRDAAADDHGNYHIRSLYFDDLYDSALTDKLSGIEHRNKYRLRIYNLKDTQIKLECKHKHDQFIHKRSVEISREVCDAMIAGNPTPLLRVGHPLANEVYIKMRSDFLRPKVIVDYIREAYISSYQNVRITFDKHLKTGYLSKDLFDKQAPMTSAFDDVNQVIVEVKFDHYLPSYYHRLIQTRNVQRSAISKYCICRKFE